MWPSTSTAPSASTPNRKPGGTAGASDRKLPRWVKKVWGWECWFINTDKYCVKYLYLDPGWQCSLHRHIIKDETFMVLAGACTLEYGEATRDLNKGDSQRIFAGTWHRFRNTGDSVCHILEGSTTHSDADVERKEESKRISGQ